MNKYISVTGQILGLFPKAEFYEAVRKTGSEKGAKGFSSWEHFASMLFCQIGQAHSLREIVGGLSSAMGKLRHLGIDGGPKRSTLSYANNHRPWQLYETIFYSFLQRCMGQSGGKKQFKFNNKLYSIDATIIELCASLFPWAEYRQTKGAVKLHLLLDHEGYLPVFADLTKGNIHEIKVVQRLSFPKGSIIAMDMGYTDYGLYGRWTEEGVYFVTRQKGNAKYEVIEQRPIPQNKNILQDEIIRLTGYYASLDCPYDLRRIEVWDEQNDRVIVLLTNHLKFGSTTIAAIYKDRWRIENFFKDIKQNLRIKTFVGTSPNAVATQIWTALIAILVLKYMQFRSTFGWSLSNLIAMLRYNLFTYRDLWEWLNNPFSTPPVEPETYQPGLFQN
ncbi:MAG TPA: IS4 family transposase [Bacteroidales bacterium]|nr:IS4 family transposase [Bacteroidales bacterium]HQM99382.1 IS4 family transposase [Bacteroidales bacterium]